MLCEAISQVQPINELLSITDNDKGCITAHFASKLEEEEKWRGNVTSVTQYLVFTET
jgi:hypothetical protein